MAIRSIPVIKSILSTMRLWKAVAFAAGCGLSMLSYPLHAAPASGGDTVQGLYDALLSTMKNARILGQSGRFTQLEPVIRRSFDIASMSRLGRPVLGQFDGGAAPANDRKLWTLHLGDIR